MDFIDPKLEAYVAAHSGEEPAILQNLNRDTYANVLMPRMLSGHVQGRILAMFCQMIAPKRILELGTFTGYSAICLAEGLKPDGLLYTIDINEELEEMAKTYFEKAGISSRTKQFIGNAIEIIPKLDEEFDLVFIDADKLNYSKYYDLVFDKLKIGGYIIADNILWSGKVLTEDPKDKDLEAIKIYNQKVKNDSRVSCVVLPLRDGISIVRKNSN
ncbi:MAG: O-methyltransferase [Cytophagales bacterium]|nr:MAG: O-methyltransferase [Cytophagales bacterium]